jgi:hypothetical protein
LLQRARHAVARPTGVRGEADDCDGACGPKECLDLVAGRISEHRS